MKRIFVNLKRWEVPRVLGGVCPEEQPGLWVRRVMRESVELQLVEERDTEVIFLLPEGLLLPAREELEKVGADEESLLRIGVQGVYRDNVEPEGNFGAFTTNLPAASARTLGATWTIVGHSEERKDKLGVLTLYDENIQHTEAARRVARDTVSGIVNQETLRGLESGLDILFCVGETGEERGEGSFEEQKPRIIESLRKQVEIGLTGVSEFVGERQIVVGYEPVWAIGPGKTPPGPRYIEFTADVIKDAAEEIHGFRPDVVYGGGLKAENAESIGSISSLDGGLVALTKFTEPIGFDTRELRTIIDKYIRAGGQL